MIMNKDPMKHLYRRQRGMSPISIFLILLALACFLAFIFTIFPLYNESVTVKGAMQAVLSQPPANRQTVKDIRRIFLRNAEINNIERFNDNSVRELVNVRQEKDTGKTYLHVKYQAENRLFENIYLMLDFDETLELTGSVPQ